MKSKYLRVSVLAAALLVSVASSPAIAQSTFTPRVDHSQETISWRIQQGLASGHITPSEAQALLRRDNEIQMRETQYKSYGNITAHQRQQLRDDLSDLSSDVERTMANREGGRPAGTAVQTPGIDNQDAQISQRIDEGLRSGRITPREARKLLSRQREISRHDAYFRSDGIVTLQERRQLRNELTSLRNEVERMMRNERRRRD